MDEPTELHGYVASLISCLRAWDPQGEGAEDVASTSTGDPAVAREAFVEALTEISALPADGLDMEIRRLLVEGGDDHGDDERPSRAHLDHLVGALGCRDVLLKCKAANAIGAICASRVAGQRLLETHGPGIRRQLIKMVTCRNTWAQADALFVFGWITVIAPTEDPTLEDLRRLVPVAIRHITRTLETGATSTGPATAAADRELRPRAEEESNLRIYGLVFLLNVCQRDIEIVRPHLAEALTMLRLLALVLLRGDGSQTQTQPPALSQSQAALPEPIEPSEAVELLRLVITLLSTLVVQLEAPATATILDLKMIPTLLKLTQLVERDDLQEQLEPDEREDLPERLRLTTETVLGRRKPVVVQAEAAGKAPTSGVDGPLPVEDSVGRSITDI